MALLLLTFVALLAAPPSWAGDRSSVNAYLRQVARHVDPSVLRQGKLTSHQVDALRTEALSQPAPLRVLVLPVSRLRLGHGGVAAHLSGHHGGGGFPHGGHHG